MQLRYFFLIFFVALATNSKAQEFEGGLLAGIAGSQIDGDQHGMYNKPGIIAGAFVRYPLLKNIYWQVEFKYIGKGAASNNLLSSDSTTLPDVPKKVYRQNLHYAEMPFLFIYNYNKRFSFESGLGLGYLVGASGTDEFGDYIDNTEVYNSVDYNYLLGMYYQLSPRICANFRFSYSIVPIAPFGGNHITILNQVGWFNNSISASFYFRLDKNAKK